MSETIVQPLAGDLIRLAQDEEAEECAKIADERARRIIDGKYDQGFADAAEFIRDDIRTRIAARKT